MKKKVYEKPMLISEAFIPNEYVAACAENPGYTKYSFTCNAGEGVTHGILITTKYVWDVYVDGKKITRRGYYGPCGSTHTVTVPAGVFIVKSAVVVLRISLAVAVGNST